MDKIEIIIPLLLVRILGNIMAASEPENMIHPQIVNNETTINELCDFSIIKLSKAKNGENADKEETYIVSQLNNPNTTNAVAKKLRDHFIMKSPEIYSIQSTPHFVKLGGRQNSNDIRETISGITIELKKVSKLKKNKPRNPLTEIPQFNQVTKGKLRDFYLDEWYQSVLPNIKVKYNIQADISDYQTWVKCDAGQGGKQNVTNFTKELEGKYKGKLSGIKNDFVEELKQQIRKEPMKYRQMVFEDFRVYAKEALDKKDCWCLYNDVNGSICHIYNKVNYPDDLTPEHFTLDDKSKNISYKISHPSGLFRGAMICWKNNNSIRNVAFKCK